MLIKSRGKGASKTYNTNKLTPVERLESLYEKNNKYNPDIGKLGNNQIQSEAENIYRDAKNQ